MVKIKDMKKQICRILATAMLISLVSNIPIYSQELSKNEINKKEILNNHSKSKSTKQSTNQTKENVNNDDITLVVSADGVSKDEAIKTALRSAIEQAYGAFVSSNTTILNDELIKDEIVTISHGNIKNYSEILSNVMSDGRFFVTLKATVSISKLRNYAQGKGAKVEIDGATLSMNVKMKELNKQNEIKVLENLEKQLNNIPHLYDYELELQEPRLYRLSSGEEAWGIPGRVHLLFNANTQLYNDLLFNTLNSLNMRWRERDEYKAIGLPIYSLHLDKITSAGTLFEKVNSSQRYIYLRSDFFTGNKHDLKKTIPGYYVYPQLYRAATKFIISDNLTSPTKLKWRISKFVEEYDLKIYKIFTYQWTMVNIEKKFLGSEPVLVPQKKNMIGEKVGQIEIIITIPKDDIGKYTHFRIEPEPNSETRHL